TAARMRARWPRARAGFMTVSLVLVGVAAPGNGGLVPLLAAGGGGHHTEGPQSAHRKPRGRGAFRWGAAGGRGRGCGGRGGGRAGGWRGWGPGGGPVVGAPGGWWVGLVASGPAGCVGAGAGGGEGRGGGGRAWACVRRAVAAVAG